MYSVIAFDGQVYGPVDISTLIAWCQQGRIVASTHLVETQTGRTFLASDMPELRAMLAQSQAQTPQAFAPATTSYGPPMQSPYMSQAQFPSQLPYGAPNQPYGAYAAPKSKTTALLLCFFLGGFGAHRFYLGHRASAFGMLICGCLSFEYWQFLVAILIWSTVDFIRLLSGSMADAQGIPPR